jgi:hypothetical protein
MSVFARDGTWLVRDMDPSLRWGDGLKISKTNIL